MDAAALEALEFDLLGERHRTDAFDCVREPALNDWLKQRALTNQQRGLSRVHVLACPEGKVRAYFTLSGHVLSSDHLASRDRPNGARTDCNAQLVGRFAIDKTMKGQDLGSVLMDLVFQKYLEILSVTTCAFLCLDAKNDWLVSYYRDNFGFKASAVGQQTDGGTFMYLKTSAIQKRFADEVAEVRLSA
jgi:hypothetical protein